MKHIEILKNLNACSEAVEWAYTQPDLETAWNNCKQADWMLWLDRAMNLFSDRDRRLMACAFVRRTPVGDGRMVWDLLTDERSRNAVEVAERYAKGEATDEELSAAWDAAWDTASAAWSVAWDAAGSAGYEAGRLAWDTAYEAVRLAVYAAGSAVYAARDAVRFAQSDIIREFGNPFIGNEKKP